LTKRAIGHIAFDEGFEKVADIARNALALLRIGSIRENAGGDGQHMVEIWGRRGLSLWSWGEIIGIRVSGNEPGGSLVEAVSECVVPTEILDNGQNKKNLESFFAALRMQLRIVGPVHIEEKRWGSG
jgi:hypothetical protein